MTDRYSPRRVRPGLLLPLALAGALLSAFSSYAADSLRVKTPRHYFNTIVMADFYRKPQRDISGSSRVSKLLQSYGIRQAAFSFYTPLFTSETSHNGYTSNQHLLLTGNLFSLRPQFGGLSQQHNLVKAGIGIRYIYNTGKKGVWFIDVSPFITRDVTYPSDPFYRLASTIIYSHNVTEKFNWRLGVTKSFLWGNRLYLPVVGMRFGALDAVHFSIQFPRSIELRVPAGRSVVVSVYSRPQGGVFNFSNSDSIYFRRTSTFHFARFEVNTGARADVRAGRHFNFYVALGLSSRNQFAFYSEQANPRRNAGPYHVYFFSHRVAPSGFVNAGLVLILGRNRGVYKNKNMYDALDLNREGQIDPGHPQIQQPGRKLPKDLNLESVRDLLEEAEL